jgi:hypothetical protein
MNRYKTLEVMRIERVAFADPSEHEMKILKQQEKALERWNAKAALGVSPSFRCWVDLHRWLDNPSGDFARDWLTMGGRSPQRVDFLINSMLDTSPLIADRVLVVALEFWNRYVEAAGLSLDLVHDPSCEVIYRDPCSCNFARFAPSTSGIPLVYPKWLWTGFRETN